MKCTNLVRQAALNIKKNNRLTVLCLLLLCLCMFYPSVMQNHNDVLHDQGQDTLVRKTDKYGRFVNTVLQIVLPLATRDVLGLQQLVLVAITGTIATHGLKRALNDIEILGTRLGERPSSTKSKHNMPSGHSSLAASGAYFVCRRYGLKFAILVVPILMLTMYARVALDAHTISAVLAGALVGIFTTAVFTTRYKWPRMRLRHETNGTSVKV